MDISEALCGIAFPADVLRGFAGTRDEPLRTSPWEAMCGKQRGVSTRRFSLIRDGPLETYGGGGGWGGGRRTGKNIRPRENEMKKIHARQLTLKNVHAID